MYVSLGKYVNSFGGSTTHSAVHSTLSIALLKVRDHSLCYTLENMLCQRAERDVGEKGQESDPQTLRDSILNRPKEKQRKKIVRTQYVRQK